MCYILALSKQGDSKLILSKVSSSPQMPAKKSRSSASSSSFYSKRFKNTDEKERDNIQRASSGTMSADDVLSLYF